MAYDVAYSLLAWTLGDCAKAEADEIVLEILRYFPEGRATIQVPGDAWETEFLLKAISNNLDRYLQDKIKIVKFRFDILARIVVPRPVPLEQIREAEHSVKDGQKHMDQRDLDSAIECFGRAIQLRPDYAEAYRYRGWAHRDKRNFHEAMADYNAAIELEPCNADFYYGRGNCKGHQGDKKGALSDYDRAIRLEPMKAEFWCTRAIMRYMYGRKHRSKISSRKTEQALTEFTRVIDLDPSCALAYACRAFYHACRGEIAEAIQDYSSAIELDPNSDYYRFRGDAFRQQGQYGQAIKDYVACLNLNSQDVDALSARASLFVSQGACDEAMADLNEAARIDRNSPAHYVARGELYLWKLDGTAAISEFRNALPRDPNNVEALVGRSVAAQLVGDEEHAAAYLDRAERTDFEKTRVSFARIIALIDKR